MSYLIVNAARSAGTIRKTIYGQFSEDRKSTRLNSSHL